MKNSLKSILWVVSGDAGARVIGFVTTAYLARVLGPSSFGMVNVGLAFLAYLSQISGAGIQVLETRNVAVGTGSIDGRLGPVLTFRLLVSVLLSLVTGLVVFTVAPESGTGLAIWLSTLLLIPLAVSLDWFFQGKERFGPLSFSKVLIASVYAALVLLFVDGPEDFGAAVLSLAGGTLAGSLFLQGLFLRAHGSFPLSVDRVVWRDIVVRSGFVGLALLAGQSAVNFGPIVLGFWFGSSEAGVFSAAMKIVLVVLLFDRVLNSILLPVITRVRGSRPEEFAELVTLLFKGVFAGIFPVAVCIGIFAPWIVTFVFGPGYDDAAIHLRFLLIYVVVTLINSVLMCSMLAAGEESRYSRLLFVGSGVLAVLVISLTGVMGPTGAALGVGLGELALFAILLSAVRRFLLIDLYPATIRSLIAGVATLATLSLLWYFPLPAVTVAALGVFALSLVLTGGLSISEFRTLAGKII